MVTVCATLYVPVAGVMAGVAAASRLMVMTEVAVLLVVKPGAVAIAFTVVVLLTIKLVEYVADDVVGCEPSVV